MHSSLYSIVYFPVFDCMLFCFIKDKQVNFPFFFFFKVLSDVHLYSFPFLAFWSKLKNKLIYMITLIA